jgi:hypothetical protein
MGHLMGHLHNAQFPNVGAWSSLQGKVEHQFTEYNITALSSQRHDAIVPPHLTPRSHPCARSVQPSAHAANSFRQHMANCRNANTPLGQINQAPCAIASLLKALPLRARYPGPRPYSDRLRNPLPNLGSPNSPDMHCRSLHSLITSVMSKPARSIAKITPVFLECELEGRSARPGPHT